MSIVERERPNPHWLYTHPQEYNMNF